MSWVSDVSKHPQLNEKRPFTENEFFSSNDDRKFYICSHYEIQIDSHDRAPD